MSRILLVDDEPTLCELLTSLLEIHGYEVQSCGGAYEAIELLEEGEFDLVLSDYRMPLGDGTLLGQWVRRNKKELPLIFMSGCSLEDEVTSEEVSGYPSVSKPLDHKELLEAIAQSLAPLATD